jgi:hypothetical protein
MPIADYAQNVQTPFFPMVRHSGDWAAGKHAKTGTAQTAATTPAAATTPDSKTASADHKSFWQDMLDVVNPLQHLPVVGTIYRAITGDKMGDVEKVAGDTLYGGPIGLVSSLADLAFEKITGKDFGDTAMAMLGLDGDKPAATATAALKPLPSRSTLAASAPPLPFAPSNNALVNNATANSASAKPAPAKAAVTPATALAQAAGGAQSGDANTQALMAAMSQNGIGSDLGMRALFAYQKSMGLSPATGADPAP